jgi:hypothetical protein
MVNQLPWDVITLSGKLVNSDLFYALSLEGEG